jgi:hypothetical protein
MARLASPLLGAKRGRVYGLFRQAQGLSAGWTLKRVQGDAV